MINSYDIDGVLNMGSYLSFLPRPRDIIITGRSEEERLYTERWLLMHCISVEHVYFNPIPFKDKTRESSGWHKANTINKLISAGLKIGLHFEDDPIQAEIIELNCPGVKVVRLVHDLVEKENVWRG